MKDCPRISTGKVTPMESLVRREAPRPGVVHLTLHRPDKRNALNIALLEALLADLDDVRGCRVLVLRAAGPVFCAGMDLEEARDHELATRSGDLIREVITALYRFPAVTIARVQGPALAGGAGLMAACDLAIAAEGASFAFPEVRRGLVAGLVMPLLRRQVGERQARALLLCGDSIAAHRAVEIGLLTRAVPEEELDRAVDDATDAVLQGAPGALLETRRLFNQLSHHELEADLALAREVHRHMRTSAEAREGLAAFQEKRKPDWV